MCKVTNYIDSGNFGKLYDIICSQFQYFDRGSYWAECYEIQYKQFAIWERLGGSASGDRGCVGTNLICFHRHLKLSNRTSPYFIIKEIREYLSFKLGSDIFKNSETFRNWEKQFPGGRFARVSHDYQNLID